MDNPRAKRPERRTAIIAHELKKFNIHIAALSETRRPGDGQLNERGGGYTFFWKGKSIKEPRIHGVGFAVSNKLLGSLLSLPVGISERLMVLELRLAKNKIATVISAYAPTLQSPDTVKEEFYGLLETTLSQIPKDNKVILLGDFNARVGKDPIWQDTLGHNGIGKNNSNGLLLLTKCAEHDLIITNTQFRQKDKFNTSWQHPRSKHWHLIDYVIVRAKDKNDVCITRAMFSADDCSTDHRLIRSKMSLEIAPNHSKSSKKIRSGKINTDGFKDVNKVDSYQKLLQEKLPTTIQDNINLCWKDLKTAILTSCREAVGEQ